MTDADLSEAPPEDRLLDEMPPLSTSRQASQLRTWAERVAADNKQLRAEVERLRWQALTPAEQARKLLEARGLGHVADELDLDDLEVAGSGD